MIYTCLYSLDLERNAQNTNSHLKWFSLEQTMRTIDCESECRIILTTLLNFL